MVCTVLYQAAAQRDAVDRWSVYPISPHSFEPESSPFRAPERADIREIVAAGDYSFLTDFTQFHILAHSSVNLIFQKSFDLVDREHDGMKFSS